MTKKTLITGAAGFIGYHTAIKLASKGKEVIAIDSMNSYYDQKLKEARRDNLKKQNIPFIKADLADAKATQKLFEEHKPDCVIHLAAQAGVRFSIENPLAYSENNLVAFMHVLEACRHHGGRHLVYASSSSVYGLSAYPFSEQHNTDHPISLYAATKKANEALAHSYAHLYQLPTTGLRFFTVYGPWGRPDMAYYSFTQKILAGEAISVFGNGDMERDFTYIDDATEAIIRIADIPATPDSDWQPNKPNPGTSFAPWRLYNIGNNNPITLEKFISTIEKSLGRKAIKDYKPMQPGDVKATAANINALKTITGFSPSTPLEEGIARFVEWYREFHA